MDSRNFLIQDGSTVDESGSSVQLLQGATQKSQLTASVALQLLSILFIVAMNWIIACLY